MADAARNLLATTAASETSAHTAAATVEISAHLAERFAELVGAVGARALLERAVVLTRKSLPWLTSSPIASHEPPWAQVRAAIAAQERGQARDAFVLLFLTFVGLLGRMLGDVLVRNFLHDQWPDVFAQKEST